MLVLLLMLMLLIGSLSSPPKSISPVALSANSDSRLWSNPLSKPGPHHHLPAIRPSAAGMAAAGLTPSAAGATALDTDSNTSSRSASPLPKQQQQQQQQQQQHLPAFEDALAAASAGSSFSAAYAPSSKAAVGSAGGIAAAAMAAAQGVSAAPSNLDVGASQLLSISALSDLQLPSFASSLSVAESQALAQSRLSWEPSAQQQ
jgi:hypothetical protein